MRKILVLLVFACLATTFGLKRSDNWTPINYTVTSNTKITLPYSRTGFLVKNLGANPVNVVMSKAGVVATDNVLSLNWFDYYPNSFMNATLDSITLNVSSGTTSVYVETYELNE